MSHPGNEPHEERPPQSEILKQLFLKNINEEEAKNKLIAIGFPPEEADSLVAGVSK